MTQTAFNPFQPARPTKRKARKWGSFAARTLRDLANKNPDRVAIVTVTPKRNRL